MHQSDGERQPLAEEVFGSVHATDVILAGQGRKFAALLHAQEDSITPTVQALQVAALGAGEDGVAGGD